MKLVLNEFGMLIVYILSVVVVITVLSPLVSDDGALAFTYNTNMLYTNDLFTDKNITDNEDLYDSLDNASNIVVSLHKPNFIDNGLQESDLIIEVPADVPEDHKSYYSYDEVLSLFSGNGKIKTSKWNGSGYSTSSLNSDVEIVITKYSPVTSGIDNAVVLTDVPVTDKFGNEVYDPDGNLMMTKVIAYTESVYNRDNINEFYIDWDVSSRYKVVYRYTDDTLKAEYTAMFVNNIREAKDIYQEVYEDWANNEESEGEEVTGE